MDLTRRQLLAGAGSVGLLAFLAGCAPGNGGSPTTDIDFWYAFADARQRDYFTRHFVEDYAGPGRVKLSVKSVDTLTRLTQTALAAGKGPDIVVTPGPSQIGAYTRAGYLTDLSDAASRFGWDKAFSPWALQASSFDGKLMTLPTSYESLVMYTVPETLSRLGAEVPASGEQFEDFCREAAGRGLVPVAAGNADYKGANEWFLTMVFNHYAGPDAVYSALRGETAWTDPVFVEAVTKLADWFQQGWFGGGVDAYFTNQFPKVYQQLASGEAASMISGTWEFASLGEYFTAAAGDAKAWDWSTLPPLREGVPADVFSLGIGQSTGVNAKSRSAEASLEYLDFLATDVKTIAAAVEEIDFQPPPIALAAADFTANADPRTVRLYTELPTAKTIGYTSWTFFPQETESYLITEIEKVFTGSQTPAAFLDGMQEIFAGELSSGGVPQAPSPSGLTS
ncbi:ABC transporter substrate-binding protein [Cellulomonas sp. Y8]|uniref:ABC transporter substrate-binding protein n=1 Tax=Cellulomonas sp. Y8 TaxID=2591145 RepID=UPI003D71A29D